MHLLIARGTIPVGPDACEEEIELLVDLADRSRAEDGVLEYRVTEDVDDPMFRVFEQYTDEIGVSGTHSEHVKSFQERLPELLVGEVMATRFDVASVSDLDG